MEEEPSTVGYSTELGFIYKASLENFTNAMNECVEKCDSMSSLQVLRILRLQYWRIRWGILRFFLPGYWKTRIWGNI